MLKAFLHLLDTRFSFLKETPLLLAVSGGIDSMVLIDLCQKSALNISLAHCNFKLRADESDADEHFIGKIAKTHSLDVFSTSFETETFAAGRPECFEALREDESRAATFPRA